MLPAQGRQAPDPVRQGALGRDGRQRHPLPRLPGRQVALGSDGERRYGDGGAENIGRGYTSAEDAVQSWMATGGHRRNILNCKLTATGVGAVDGSTGPWWTQDFGYS
ncbi:CAP domain-containing protein [Streptosporangium lutulentum]